MLKLGEKEETEQLFKSTCKVGHNLRKYISRVAFMMFNGRAKNYASEKKMKFTKVKKVAMAQESDQHRL